MGRMLPLRRMFRGREHFLRFPWYSPFTLPPFVTQSIAVKIITRNGKFKRVLDIFLLRLLPHKSFIDTLGESMQL